MAQDLALPSAIHLAAVVPAVAIGVAVAIWHIRCGNVRGHKRFMVGATLGLFGAGLGALAPGRFLAVLLF